MTKDAATKLITKHAASTDAAIRCLVTEARYFLRIGDYAAVAQILSNDSIARQHNLY